MAKDNKPNVPLSNRFAFGCVIFVSVFGFCSSFFLKSLSLNSDASSFAGSIFGAFITGMITLFVLLRTIENNQDTLQSTIQENRRKEAIQTKRYILEQGSELNSKLYLYRIYANKYIDGDISNADMSRIRSRIEALFLLLKSELAAYPEEPACTSLIEILSATSIQFEQLAEATHEQDCSNRKDYIAKSSKVLLKSIHDLEKQLELFSKDFQAAINNQTF